MAALASELRSKLERAVVEARDAAEAGARAALEALAVNHHEPYSHMEPDQRVLRNHLRARARQLGDRQDSNGRIAISHLVHECAYEHWHRMLFARFLAENGLLIEPDMGVSISLEEAEELAKEEGVDVWAYASRCAQRMLPQIFRPDDPLLQLSFATEHMLKLERLLSSLEPAVFTATDALGWVYQFWQSKKKDEVNRSEVKIGADELPAVTQLFTEPYMVSFLIHNTLGAWWAGKKLAESPTLAKTAKSEDNLRAAVALPSAGWEYLRFVRGATGKRGPWRPAAGRFDGWPKTAAELKVLDPCCGSGHFLVAALHHLVPVRMAEEGLSAGEAVNAVLRDNIHGLEIDERCCQIAAFALAFAAWTYPDAGGYRTLPEVHIACSGVGPQSTKEQWLKLVEQSGAPIPKMAREPVKNGLLNLHRLFSQAPTLGSLINPAELPGDLIAADYETLQPHLRAPLSAEKTGDETHERAVAAAGMVKAADLLAGGYTLVITNVPYLGRGKQDDLLKAHLERHFKEGKADLATAFVLRSLKFCAQGASVAMVTPQNWIFQAKARDFRSRILKRERLSVVARLGASAFQTPMWDFNIMLVCFGHQTPSGGQTFAGIDVESARTPEEKAARLQKADPVLVQQALQLKNPDGILTFENIVSTERLGEYVDSFHGITTTDYPKFGRCFWESWARGTGWVFQQSTVSETMTYGGRESVLLWEDGDGGVKELQDSGAPVVITGLEAWGRQGVVVNRLGNLYTTLYTGDAFDTNVAVLVPRQNTYLPAVWAFCSSPEFRKTIRTFNQQVVVEYIYYPKAPFDLAHWQKVADEQHPNGLPEPESDDPTQWLFHGRPEESSAPLQAAVARMLGYRWPAELDEEMRLSKRARKLVKQCDKLLKFSDDDGIVCIPSVRGEEPGAERLRALLVAAYGKEWSSGKERELVAATGSKETDLEGWLRNDFFEQHCRRVFHHRPFVWHVWDGRKRDGFHALVNYHKLAEGGGKGRKLLENLSYSYLGEWITRQKDEVRRGEGGAEDRLAAALELQKRLVAILDGEPPFDIFVRWKPLSQQPVGWEPDINDGVRISIRPFLADDLPNGRKGAGILRFKPNINWRKDRGKEPERPRDEYPWFWTWNGKTQDFTGGKKFDGNRHNACHYTNECKRKARKRSRGRT